LPANRHRPSRCFQSRPRSCFCCLTLVPRPRLYNTAPPPAYPFIPPCRRWWAWPAAQIRRTRSTATRSTSWSAPSALCASSCAARTASYCGNRPRPPFSLRSAHHGHWARARRGQPSMMHFSLFSFVLHSLWSLDALWLARCSVLP
jgi:hypothetical protein